MVIYFYPKDETPSCTKEACSFRDNIEQFEDQDVILLGISPDDSKTHESFIENHQLNFTLLADPTLDVCRKFDVIREVDGRPRIERTTFVVDARGIITWIERPVNVEGHVERVLQAVHEISGL
ncbi:MAG: peroxiredoxin [Parachlamydiaceae bacterium]|nr:MAG: peroxiredoxin [Parachlamydiaceae bacterium]